MSATQLMTLAVVLYVVARWIHNQPAVNVHVVVGGLIAIVVIAGLDHGHSEPVAKGLAWLFLIGAGYGVVGPLAKLAATSAKFNPPAAQKKGLPR